MMNYDFWFMIHGLGLGVKGAGLRFRDLRFMVSGSGSRVEG